jgi:Ca2+-binding RTX toxin-like protein
MVQYAILGLPPESFYSYFNNNHLGGTSGQDTITTTIDNSIVTSGAENDTLISNSNWSLLLGGDGDDSITTNGSNNFLYGGYGNDTVTTLGQNSELYGEEGNDTLTGGTGINNSLFGGAGDDMLTSDGDGASLTGGLGNDTFNGGYNRDKYYFNLGDGQDVIDEQGGNTAASKSDYLYLGAGITTADVTVTHSGTDMVIHIGGGGDQVRVLNWYGNAANWLENLSFNDGSLWNVTTLNDLGNQNNEVHGTANNDTITGTTGVNNYLYGESGDDILTGKELNDVIVGGIGNDALIGSSGNDSYRMGFNEGLDSINDSTGIDEIEYSGVDHGQLWFWQEGDDLRIGIINTDDWLTIDDWFIDSDKRIETFNTLSDGYTLLESQVQQLVDAMAVFDVQAAGNLNVPQADIDAVQPAISAAWSDT